MGIDIGPARVSTVRLLVIVIAVLADTAAKLLDDEHLRWAYLGR